MGIHSENKIEPGRAYTVCTATDNIREASSHFQLHFSFVHHVAVLVH